MPTTDTHHHEIEQANNLLNALDLDNVMADATGLNLTVRLSPMTHEIGFYSQGLGGGAHLGGCGLHVETVNAILNNPANPKLTNVMKSMRAMISHAYKMAKGNFIPPATPPMGQVPKGAAIQKVAVIGNPPGSGIPDWITKSQAMSSIEAMKEADTVLCPLPVPVVFPPGEMLSAPTIGLAAADKVFQPVRGTSPTSRYFVVAVSAGMTLAMRYQGQSLAVRVEGEELCDPSVRATLNALGFDKVSEVYASVHVQCANDTRARQMLGSVTAGLGYPWSMVAARSTIECIKGKGS